VDYKGILAPDRSSACVQNRLHNPPLTGFPFHATSPS